MNVWMRKCRKQAVCRYCKQPILNKDFMVVGQHRKGKWRFNRYWHPECWIIQAKQKVEGKEYQETRGCKKMEIGEEDRKKRFKILARRASVLQRIKIAVGKEDYVNIVHLGEMLEKLREEIEPLGGIPAAWDKKKKEETNESQEETSSS